MLERVKRVELIIILALNAQSLKILYFASLLIIVLKCIQTVTNVLVVLRTSTNNIRQLQLSRFHVDW